MSSNVGATQSFTGYQGDPRSVREIKDKDLLEFLLHPHQLVNDDVYDIDYPEDDEALYEGALILCH